MEVVRPKVNFKDERGEITDILHKQAIEYVTLITSNKGAIRGNHYHEKTVQFCYMVSGKMRYVTQMPGQNVVSTVVGKGDLFVSPVLERHAMLALEDSAFMVFTLGPRGGEDYEKDTHRLAEPIIASASGSA